MSFNSIEYFIFLPIVWLLHQVAPDRFRWLILLLTSIGFYAALKAPYLLVVLFMVVCFSYTCGNHIAAHQDEAIRKRWLWIGSFACVAILALMKYMPFLDATLHVSPFTFHFSLIISIGVSYFVFQAISYLVDIYLGIIEPEAHFGKFFLSLAFFPKLLQGPIERSGELLPQLHAPYRFEYDNMRFGLLLFAWGLFKKIVLADRLALYVNAIYGDVHAFTGLPLLLASFAYSFQIYFDFSGYTDMALGTARLFNINLTQNFNSPYLATSVADFWRRWHISFSRWILDYIFKPLQMAWRNAGVKGTAVALIITFLISGLWHGVKWGFLIWGGLHGLYLASSVFYKPYQKKLHKMMGIEKTTYLKVWQVFVTFNLVSFAWIFFRANTLGDAWYIIRQLGRALSDIPHLEVVKTSLTAGLSLASIKALMMAGLIYAVVELSRQRINFVASPIWVRWGCYILLGLSLLILSTTAQYRFVYNQF